MKKLLSLCLVVSAFWACNSPEKQLERITLADFGEEIPLTAERVLLQDSIFNPYKMVLMDSLLFVLDLKTDNFVHVYDLNSKKMICEGVTIGNGPNEIVSADICPSYKKDHFCLLEKSKSEVRLYDIRQLVEHNEWLPFSTITFEDQVTCAEIMSPSVIVAENMYDSLFKFNYYDFNGKLTGKGGGYYQIMDGQSLQEHKDGYMFRFVTNHKDRIFVTHVLTDMVEVYDGKGTLLKRMLGPDGFLPDVKMKNNGPYSVVASNSDSKDAYFNLRTAGDEVFIQYTGTVSGPTTPSIFDKLFVFDWDGKPLRRYRLSENTPFFVVDPVRRIIYGVAQCPEYQLVSYKY